MRLRPAIVWQFLLTTAAAASAQEFRAVPGLGVHHDELRREVAEIVPIVQACFVRDQPRRIDIRVVISRAGRSQRIRVSSTGEFTRPEEVCVVRAMRRVRWAQGTHRGQQMSLQFPVRVP